MIRRNALESQFQRPLWSFFIWVHRRDALRWKRTTIFHETRKAGFSRRITGVGFQPIPNLLRAPVPLQHKHPDFIFETTFQSVAFHFNIIARLQIQPEAFR